MSVCTGLVGWGGLGRARRAQAAGEESEGGLIRTHLFVLVITFRGGMAAAALILYEERLRSSWLLVAVDAVRFVSL
jgi:hypothetical protein